MIRLRSIGPIQLRSERINWVIALDEIVWFFARIIPEIFTLHARGNNDRFSRQPDHITEIDQSRMTQSRVFVFVKNFMFRKKIFFMWLTKNKPNGHPKLNCSGKRFITVPKWVNLPSCVSTFFLLESMVNAPISFSVLIAWRMSFSFGMAHASSRNWVGVFSGKTLFPRRTHFLRGLHISRKKTNSNRSYRLKF